MVEAIRTFIVLESGVSQSDIERALPRGGDVDVVGVVHGLEDAWVRLHETSNDLLVVACAGQSEEALSLIHSAVKERPRRPVVVFEYDSPNGFTSRVFAAGADDVIVLPESPDDVLFALQKAIARKTGGTEASTFTRAPLICVLGPKGGTGKTLTATSLAVALAELGKSVALVDLDLQFGDVGLCLGLPPEKTIFDLVRTGGSLDEEKLDGFLVAHSSGVKVMLAPSRPDHAAVVSVEFLREVYGTLRQMSDYVDRRHAARIHARGDRDDRQCNHDLHGRHARRALAQEHEARARDARADGIPERPRQARAQPGPQPRRHLRRRRGRDHGPRAGCLRPERSRHSAGDQRGEADSHRATAVRGLRGLPASSAGMVIEGEPVPASARGLRRLFTRRA